MTSSAMPSADAAWLHMDRPLNPMVVNAVMWFPEQLDWDRVRDVLEERLVDRFPRFRRRVVEPLGRAPRFEDDPDFDLDLHLHRLALPAPGDHRALEELVSDLITPPLDPTRPLWHAYLIEGYGDGCAVLIRIHHCLADGIALARVLLALTDESPDAHIAPEGPHAPWLIEVGRRIAETAVHEGLETLANPAHLAELAATATRDAGTLAKLLASPGDARTVLKAPLHGTRRVAWSAPFPLDRIKRAGRRAHATINDVLIAAVTGALRTYLEGAGGAPDDIRIMVPFNLRPLDEPLPRDLGNDFALILLSLPVGIERRDERLREVKLRMDAIKDSHEGPISYGILSAIGRMPPAVEDRLVGFFSEKASAVVTNVPGPREPVYLAGTRLGGVLVWAPCSGTIGMTVSIFSYAGEVTVGFMADTGLVPDPHPLVDAFDTELRALCRGTRHRRRASAGA